MNYRDRERETNRRDNSDTEVIFISYFIFISLFLFIRTPPSSTKPYYYSPRQRGQRYTTTTIHDSTAVVYARNRARLSAIHIIIYTPLQWRPKNRFTILAINPITPFTRLHHSRSIMHIFCSYLSSAHHPRYPPPTPHNPNAKLLLSTNCLLTSLPP